MKSNKEQYILQLERYSVEKKKLKTLSLVYTVLRLLSFVAIVFFMVLYVKYEQQPIWFIASVLSMLLLAYAAKKDARHLYRCRLVDQFIAINKAELDYWEQNVSGFDAGSEFMDANNPFTSDLDIFGEYSIFQAINRSATTAGRAKLAAWFSTSLLQPSHILARQQAVAELKDDYLFRQHFQAIGQLDKDSLSDLSQINAWVAERSWLKNKKILLPVLYLSPVFTIGSILAAVFIPIFPASIPEAFCLLMLVVTGVYLKLLNRVHHQLGAFSNAFSKYARLLELVKQQQFHSSSLSAIYTTLFGEQHNAAKAFSALSKLLASFDQRANLLVAVVLNALYLRDLQLLVRLENWKHEYDSYLPQWVDATTEIDALCSLANFSFNHAEFIFPEITDQVLVEAKNLGHPLLPSATRVDNDFCIERLGQFNIVTGANMAGKSTFLRSVGVNLLLASCGAPVCASTFRFKPMVLFTSMRTTDNLAKHTSYFHAELLRLKSLIAAAEGGHELFVILDEILKGTNSTDKLIGSRKFLTKLKDLSIAGLVATHDLALGELSTEFPRQFKNICFEVEIADRNIKFDYKLREGVSQNMNATVLMEQMGIV